MDMEAGIEHLGRGTAQGVDVFIVVVEPGIRSIQTFKHVKKLAKDIGIEKIFVVANKIRNKKDEEFVLENVDEKECLGFIHYSDTVGSSDRVNQSPYDSNEETVKEVKNIKQKLEMGVF